jgi:nickel-dependent lactate racemase
MRIALAYGTGVRTLELADANVANVLYPKEKPGVTDPITAVKESLTSPIGSPPLREILARYSSPKVVVVVNDVTRPVPYQWVLPPLMDELQGVPPDRLEFVVATGIHRAHTDEENRQLFGKELVDRYSFRSHDCDGDLVSVGILSNGVPLQVDRAVVEADVVIGTGLIGLHYFAGYSGGRKSILPGVSDRESITRCHAQMVDPRAKCGQVEDNPVHAVLMEGARKAGLSFIVNVVTNSRKEIVQVVSGDAEAAWLEGVKTCAEMSVSRVEQKYPVVIVGADGYPRDINVYQAQKALDNAAEVAAEGGTIILVAECREGFGEDTFEEWMLNATGPSDVVTRFNTGFKLGGHKAFAIARVVLDREVVLVSDLSRDDVETLFFTHMPDLKDAIDYVRQKHGDDFQALIMPEGGLIYPDASTCAE